MATDPERSDAWYAAGTDDPCTRCGECCRQLPCSHGKTAPDGSCVELRPWGCALVARDERVAQALLVGWGCGATFIPKVLGRRAQKARDPLDRFGG